VGTFIDAGTLEYLVALDESAMPSNCVVHTRTLVENPRGGSTLGVWTDRNATPLKCRVIEVTTRSQLVADQTRNVGNVTILVSLTDLKAQAVEIDNDDELTVTTVVPLPGSDLETTERYKVVAVPVVPSYATNLPVPCVKLG
jgi:hypothetical protein